MTEALKPCPIPWCGGKAKMGNGYPDMRQHYIICCKCGLKTPHSKPFDEDGIVELWNTRTPPPLPSNIGELVGRLREAYCASLGSHQDRVFLSEAADEITRLNALIEEAREVVEPFANVAETIEDIAQIDEDDDRIWIVQAYGCRLAELTEEHFHAASRWLEKAPATQDSPSLP